MAKLNNKKIKYIIDSRIKDKHSAEDLSDIYKITPRWIQILVWKYKQTGEYPKMNHKRRPKTELTDEQKALIDKAYNEVFLGAKMLRHYIINQYNKKIPQNKMHKHMLEMGYAKPNKRKQQKRKRCRYEREHSLFLLHMDWTTHNGKEAIGVQDDASRKIIFLMEVANANTKNSIKAVKMAQANLEELESFIRAINTDRGAQFFPNNSEDREKHNFVEYLISQNIKHIPSRVNNPQTNGKLERWFQEYKKHRHRFKSAEEFRIWFNNRIHGALNYRRGETPEKAFMKRIDSSVWVGLRFKLIGL